MHHFQLFFILLAFGSVFALPVKHEGAVRTIIPREDRIPWCGCPPWEQVCLIERVKPPCRLDNGTVIEPIAPKADRPSVPACVSKGTFRVLAYPCTLPDGRVLEHPPTQVSHETHDAAPSPPVTTSDSALSGSIDVAPPPVEQEDCWNPMDRFPLCSKQPFLGPYPYVCRTGHDCAQVYYDALSLVEPFCHNTFECWKRPLPGNTCTENGKYTFEKCGNPIHKPNGIDETLLTEPQLMAGKVGELPNNLEPPPPKPWPPHAVQESAKELAFPVVPDYICSKNSRWSLNCNTTAIRPDKPGPSMPAEAKAKPAEESIGQACVKGPSNCTLHPMPHNPHLRPPFPLPIPPSSDSFNDPGKDSDRTKLDPRHHHPRPPPGHHQPHPRPPHHKFPPPSASNLSSTSGTEEHAISDSVPAAALKAVDPCETNPASCKSWSEKVSDKFSCMWAPLTCIKCIPAKDRDRCYHNFHPGIRPPK